MNKLNNETVKYNFEYCIRPNINVIVFYMYYDAKKIERKCERDHSV